MEYGRCGCVHEAISSDKYSKHLTNPPAKHIINKPKHVVIRLADAACDNSR